MQLESFVSGHVYGVLFSPLRDVRVVLALVVKSMEET